MTNSYASNPLLAYQPAFTYSMPIQLLIHGCVLTLLSVLSLHLIFTAKYHYPLARTNFLLLLSAVILTIISTIVVVAVINHALFNRSRFWPFMFDYVEVPMPPPDWKPLALVGWYIMQSAVTFLAHATHIQFLTLLFPSALERKLIIAFLGPLCVFASAMYFTHFLEDPNLQDLGDAIRNTATSTLSLLYTSGLLIWGYAVNRKRAWEHEGGTFGFGVISITLAFLGTAANFIEVKEDRLRWLPWLVNTVLLWQSWAGFWWWVGAGMWSGEVADLERREARKNRREDKRIRKQNKMLNTLVRTASVALDEPDPDPDPESPRRGTTSGRSAGRPLSSRPSVLSIRLRRRGAATAVRESSNESQIELDDLRTPPSHSRPLRSVDPPQRFSSAGTDVSSSLPSNDTPKYGGFFSFFIAPGCVDRWFGRLSDAHNAAAKQQARSAGEIRETEQVKKWGLRAMTQRVINEQARRPFQPGSPSRGSSSSPRPAGPSRVNQSRHPTSPLSRIRHSPPVQSDDDNPNEEWVSDPATDTDDNQPRRPSSMIRSPTYREAGPPWEPASCHDCQSREPDGMEELQHSPGGVREGYGDPPDQHELRRQRSRRPSEVQSLGSSPSKRHMRWNQKAESSSSSTQSPATTSSSQVGMDHSHSWAWKGPLMKARLRDVTNYD